MDLAKFQREHKEWVDHNFPAQRSHQPLLGIVEEVGELAHAQLKGEQEIRHSNQEIWDAKVDAVGDIVIYLASYCNAAGIDLNAAVSMTWYKVQKRDWIADPQGAGNDS